MKIIVAIEIILVFSLTLALVTFVGLSPLGEWERSVTNRYFFEYGIMIATPLLLMLVTKKNLVEYGVSLRNMRYHLDIVVTAFILFGLMHVLNLGSLVSEKWEITWWWGLWTIFGGMVLGYVREKTGCIIAPILLHGLPQAIAFAFLGR